MRTAARTFSLGTSVPAGSSTRAMTTSSSAWRRMVRSAACSIACSSVIVAGDEGSALPDQEVEVRALIGLENVVVVEAPVASLEGGLGRAPLGTSLLQLALVDQQLQPALGHIELDLVAVLDQR